MPSKRNKQRSFRRPLAVPVLSDIEEDASTSSPTPQPEHDELYEAYVMNKSPEMVKFLSNIDSSDEHHVSIESYDVNDIELEFPVYCVENNDDLTTHDDDGVENVRNSEFLHCNDYNVNVRQNVNIFTDDDYVELEESHFDYTEISELFQDYRRECQQLLSRTDKDQKYVKQLETVVRELLEQNEVLVDNLQTVTMESQLRVKELRNRLQNSAQRTEETMLALASHELYLKNFSQKHCCACCACDTRLLATRLCHGGLCEFETNNLTDETCYKNTTNKYCSMNSTRAGNMRSIHNTDQWFTSSRPRAIDAHRLECIQNLPSQIRFSSLVDRLQRQSQLIEQENRDLKHENILIRQLNSYLSGRDLSITMPSKLFDHNRNPTSIDHVNKFHHEDYEDFLHHSGSIASLSSPTSEDYDSCPISRPESLTEGRADNDSGCSTTDLIPSTTDIASLLLSDCDDDCLSDPPEMTKLIGQQSLQHSHQQSNTNKRLSHAERLVPKLYQQLLYYVAQRNTLVKQLKNESDARQQCKADIASLADCLAFELGAMQQHSEKASVQSDA